MILTPAQTRAFQKAQAVANDVLPQLEFLETLAEIYPPIQESVKQARAQRDLLSRLSETALETDRILSQ